MAGLYYEEFKIGFEFKHELTRTVTEADNLLFCAMTHNPQPLHLDEEFSKGTEFGQRIVNSLFTLGLVIGVSVGDTTLGTTIANLGMTDVRFMHPVFHGDTLRSITKVVEKRESKSRPNVGIVTVQTTGSNQNGTIVIEFQRTFMVYKQGCTPEARRVFPSPSTS